MKECCYCEDPLAWGLAAAVKMTYTRTVYGEPTFAEDGTWCCSKTEVPVEEWIHPEINGTPCHTRGVVCKFQ